MEYTVYTYNFENYLHAHILDYIKRSALDIKKSAGIQRRKDRCDDDQQIQLAAQRRIKTDETLKPGTT